MHKLRVAADFIDPRWFNEVRCHGEVNAQVIDARTIKVIGETLVLANPEEITLLPGQAVYVLCQRDFWLETAGEREQRTSIHLNAQQRRNEAQRIYLNTLRRDAEAFNASLAIPVAWQSGMKDVLSGLSENSAGNGCNAATVTHVLLLADLHDAKLHRKSGDLLCTSASKDNGKQWSAQRDSVHVDGDGALYAAKVTCTTCLRIAQRWKKQ